MSNKPETERAFDIRIMERNIRKGTLQKKDVEKYLKSLPDRSDNVAPIVADDAPRSSGRNGAGS